MMKQKTLFNKILSVVLSVAIVVSSVAGWNVMEHVQAGDGVSGYKELTFRDWGLDDQTVNASTGTKRNSQTPITSWDKVAISGTITLPANGSTQSYVNFGTSATGWTGVQLRLGASGQFALISNSFGTVKESSDAGSTNAVITPATLGYDTSSLKGQSVGFRLTFEYTDNNANILVTLTATGKNGAQGTGWLKFEKPTTENYGILVHGGGGDITIASTAQEEPEPVEYNELSFRDWGLDDQTVNASTGVKRHSKTPITSWDDVAISGTITLPTNASTNSYVFIGNTVGTWKGIKLRFGSTGSFILNGVENGFGTVVANGDGSTSNNASITPATLGYDDLKGKSVDFRLTFEYTDNDENILVTLTATGKDGAQGTVWIKFKRPGAEYFEMLVDGSGGDITIASTEEKKPEPIEYTELTFRDWGLDDQTVNASTGVKRHSKTPITSWDDVAISGTITLPTNGSTNSYVFIGNTVGTWKGIKLRFGSTGSFILNGVENGFGTVVANGDGSTSNNASITPATLGYDNLKGKSVDFRLTFQYTDNDENILVTLTATGKDGAQGTVWIKFKRPGTEYYEMLVDGSGGDITIASTEEKEPEPIEYTELTFRDWGINDLNATTATVRNSETPITSWDKVAISGTITLPQATSNESGVIIGTTASSWTGVKVRRGGSGQLLLSSVQNGFGSVVASSDKNQDGSYSTNAGITPTALGYESDISGQAIEIRVTFVYTDNDENILVTLTATGKDGAQGTSWLKFARPETENFGILVYGGAGAISIASTEEQEEPGPEPIEYTELTFRDWGINDLNATTSTVRSSETPITSWDKVAISGTITLPQATSNDSGVIIGTTASSWTGVKVRRGGSGQLLLSSVQNGFGSVVASSDKNQDGSYSTNAGITPTALGYESDISGQAIEIRVTFAYTDNNANILVTLTATGKDGAQGTSWLKFARLEMENFGILVHGGGGAITLVSAAEEDQGPQVDPNLSMTPRKELSEYSMVTFKDLGIADQTILGGVKDCNGNLNTWNGKAFTGYITFGDTPSRDIRIGGTIKNRWYGIRITPSKDGLNFTEVGNESNNRWDIGADVIGEDIKGKEILLTLTFTYVDEHNIYVGVYINGVFCGERYFKDMVRAFGNTLMVYSEKSETKIASAETPWEAFLKSEVDFRYFGFSNEKWREELAAICK